MRHSTISKLLICGLMCCGCSLADILEFGSDCDATYVVTSEGKCVFGKCNTYDDFFNNKKCPMVAPVCIKDSEGMFYCDSQCPPKYHKVVPSEKYGAECAPDSKTKCGDEEVNCLDGSTHEGWIDAVCNARHECEATRCQDTFYFTGNNCLTKAQCCGQFCQDCTRISHKVCSGMDVSAVCTDSCKDNEFECAGTCIDPMTSDTYCGSTDCSIHQCDKEQSCRSGECVCLDENLVICEDGGKCIDLMTSIDNCGDCGIKCSEMPGWVEGKCDAGRCVSEICLPGYHLETVDGTRQCVEDSVVACGDESYSCEKLIHGWVSGKCENGRCELETCADGLIPFDNECVEPIDVCGNTKCEVNEVCDNGTCKCRDGYEICGGSCYNFSQSVNHCGSCNEKCDAANAVNSCVDGKCRIDCHEGYVEKGHDCQLRNCKDQAYMCNKLDYMQCVEDEWTKIETCTTAVDNAEPVCDENNGCDYRCTDNYSMCEDKLCYNLMTDVEHCGRCDISCNAENAENRCENGKCIIICDSGYVLNKDETACVPFVCSTGAVKCDGLTPQICKDNEWISQDTCTTDIANASPTCQDAVCGYECNSGYTDCAGTCADLMTSADNCSECGNKCYVENANNGCSDGACTFECKPGYDRDGKGCVVHVCNTGEKQCNGIVSQSCQNNAWVDSETCGAPKNGTPVCNNGTCSFGCNSGYDKIGPGCELHVCNEGEVRCSGTNIETCHGNKWDPKACPKPDNGTAVCTGDKCSINCNSGYDKIGSTCVKHVCNEGAVRCSGTSVQTCHGNKWEPSENCIDEAPSNANASCQNNKCGWSCKSNYLKCSEKCIGASSVKGMKTSQNHSIHYVYGKFSDHYAIKNNGIENISLSAFLILPVTGTVNATNGINVRKEARPDSPLADNPSGSSNGVANKAQVTITNYVANSSSACSDGWFYITGNTGVTGTHSGYVCASYIINLTGSSSSGIPNCK